MIKRIFSKNILKVNYNKDLYDNILDDPNSKVARIINNFIITLVLISISILFLESAYDFSTFVEKYIFIVDFFISSIFLVEYLYRFVRSKNKVRFSYHPLNVFDFLAFAPFFVWLLFWWYISWEFLKVLRLARVFRILKLAKYIPVIVWFIKALREYKSEYKWIFLLFFIVLTIISVFVYHVESKANPEMFSSIPKSLWWAIVTMTTVWYWDMYPITILWKIIWSILIFLWPVLLAVLSSITIIVFMDVVEETRMNRERSHILKCQRCNSKNPKKANYCMICWEKIFIPINN